MSFRLVVPALALTSALLAQNIATFPSDHANVEGSSYIGNFPYSNGVSRTMALYEAWDLGIPSGHTITRIGFRQNSTFASSGYQLQLEVRMGQTNNDASTMASNYANNYIAGTTTTVFGPGLFALPNLTSNPPGQQIVWLTLTTPYVYDGSHNLLVEWVVNANSNGNTSFTYYLDVADFLSPVTAGPAGCPSSGGTPAVLTSRPTAIGSTWYLNLSSAPANSLGFLMSTVNSPLTTPYSLANLVPGIQASCMGQLSQTSILISSATTNSGGGHQWSVPVPGNRLLWNDAIVSSQVALLDFFAPGGVIVSNGDEIQFGIDPAESILYSQGSPTAVTGSLQQHTGVVTLFDHH